MPVVADDNFVNERNVADDKFGKTRVHDGTLDATTQYDVKKTEADAKKTTASKDQHR